MSTNTQHFKIGLFVSLSIVFCVAVVVVLGGNALMQEKIVMETYLDQTVQGLNVGSPVKYRGVKIGEVKNITFVGEEYASDHADFIKYDCERFVLIQMALFRRGPLDQDIEELRDSLENSIKQGLRVRLAAQGFTGVMYLEADYMDPVRFPPLPICWEAKNLYLPSAPSTAKRLIESLDRIMFRFERLDLKTPLKKVENLLDVASGAIKEASIKTLSEEIHSFIAEMHGMQGRIVELVEKLDPLLTEATEAAAAGRKILENAEAPVDEMLRERIPETVASFNSLVEKLEALAQDLPRNVEELPAVITQLKVTLKRLDNVVVDERDNIAAIIDNLRVVAENLKEFSENAKEYPSQVLFGNPPAPKEK